MKKVAALLLVLMMMFGLVACNNQAGENSQQPANSDGGAEETGSVDPGVTIPEADFTLGAVVYSLSDAVPVNVKNQLEAYAEMLNVELTVVVGNGAEGNLQGVESLIQSGVDGIFMMSAEGIDAYLPVMEEAGVYCVLGSTKVLTDSAKELAENSEIFLGQVSFDDEEVMRLLTEAAIADGATEVGLIAPTNVTPNYLGIRKQAVMDILNENGIPYYEGTGSSYFDFAGFTSTLLANYPNLEYYITVTTADSAYAPITLAEMNGKVKLYAANRSDTATQAFEDGTLQAYVAGTEHCAAEFLIMYNYLMGNPLVEDGYVDITSAPLYIDSIETQQQLEEYYNDKILYTADFMLKVDTLEELEAMAEAATLENFVAGTYMDVDVQ